MNVAIVTPASRGSRTGNRVTALRWAGLLRQLGHRVRLTTEVDAGTLRADVLFALHAARSASSARRYRERSRGRLVVALTGTDLYRDLPDSAEARASLELADALVALQPLAVERLRAMSAAWAAKARVILQSVAPIPKPSAREGSFDVCVVGHLREEKDPLRVAEAARLVPETSRLRVLQIGGALTDDWATRAREEQAENPRYEWLGELSRSGARHRLARSRLMVLPSRMEGGANVIGEAVVADTPVIATRIEGSLGLLGPDHPGYYEVGDTQALAVLLDRAERDSAYRQALIDAGRAHAPLFEPAAERAALDRLLAELARRPERLSRTD